MPKSEADSRPIYVLRIRPLPDTDPIRGLREVLKRLKRQFGFQCLACVEEKDGQHLPFNMPGDA